MMFGGADADLDLGTIQLDNRPLRRCDNDRSECLGDPDDIWRGTTAPPGASTEMPVIGMEPPVRPDQQTSKQRIGEHPRVAAIAAQVHDNRIEWLNPLQYLVLGRGSTVAH